MQTSPRPLKDQCPLEKFLILGLREEIYKISPRYLNRPESKETIKD